MSSLTLDRNGRVGTVEKELDTQVGRFSVVGVKSGSTVGVWKREKLTRGHVGLIMSGNAGGAEERKAERLG